MGRITFTAMLFCLALACFLIGGPALYDYVRYHQSGRPAAMGLPDGKKPFSLPVGGYDVHLIDVQYVGPDGKVAVPQKRLAGPVARRVAAGEKVPVVYVKSEPQYAYIDGRQPDNPWGWLLFGGVATGVALFAHRLLRREAGMATE